MSQSTRGGKRAGAGRKPSPLSLVQVTLGLPPELLRRIDLERGDVSRAEHLRRLIERGLAVPSSTG